MAKKATPKVDPKEALSAIAGEILCGHSGLIAVKAVFYGIAIVDGEIAEIPMGSVQAPPRENKVKADGTRTRGFYLNAKLTDPTELGQLHGTRFQLGANVTGVKSAEW